MLSWQKSYCQIVSKKDTSLAGSNRIIGNALIEGLRYKDLYTNEVELTKILKSTIGLKDSLILNKDLTISELAFELSKKPDYIKTHSWLITGVITGLSVALTIFLMDLMNR